MKKLSLCWLFLGMAVACLPVTLLAKAPIKKPALRSPQGVVGTAVKKVVTPKKAAKKASQKKPAVVPPSPTIIVHIHNNSPADNTGAKPSTSAGTVPVTQSGSSDGGDSSDKKANIIGGTVGGVGGAGTLVAVATTVHSNYQDIRKAKAAEQVRETGWKDWAKNADPNQLIDQAKVLIKNQMDNKEKPDLRDAKYLEIIDAELKGSRRVGMKTSVVDIENQIQKDLMLVKLAQQKEDAALKKQQQDRPVQEDNGPKDDENNKETTEEESEIFIE